MVRPGTPSESLLSALAGGQVVLFVGAGLAHGLTALDWGALLDSLRPQVTDASGWDTLDPQVRLQLLVESLGRERLEVELAALVPSAEVLRTQVTDFHKTLLGLPCPIIVSTAWDGLVEATLDALDLPYRVAADDDDVERALAVQDGSRLVVKLFGDLLAGDPVVATHDDLREYARRRPATLNLLRHLAGERSFLLYGLGLGDPAFALLTESILSSHAVGRSTFAIMKEPNALLAQYWARRKVEIVSGNTWSELERWVEGLRREAERRHRGRFSLEAILAESLPDHRTGVLAAASEAQGVVARRLTGLEPFRWLHASPAQIEDWTDERDELRGAFRTLRALHREGVPVGPEAFATAAELLLKFGHLEDARSAVDLALATARRGDRTTSVSLRSALGRVLCRLGELERARPLLEHALTEGDPADIPARAAELAWLSRSVLERIEDLRDRQRERAAREVLGRFLVTFAPHFALAQPPEGAGPAGLRPAEHEAWRWSLYYVNFRLGRLFALASELAGQSGAVYAQQAVELLTRAIGLSPGKPEPYRVVRPLLLAPRGYKPDKARWERIVTQAPTDVRRKLDELEAAESRGRPRPKG